MEAKFKPYNTLDIDYVLLAAKIAQQYKNGEEIDQDEVMEVRDKACLDRQHLNGDFVISMFVKLQEQQTKNCEDCSFHKNKGKGRAKLSTDLIDSIRQLRGNGMSIRAIAKDLGVSINAVKRYTKEL